jgi:hypothetical protein
MDMGLSGRRGIYRRREGRKELVMDSWRRKGRRGKGGDRSNGEG